jgi:hypothetical protein
MHMQLRAMHGLICKQTELEHCSSCKAAGALQQQACKLG